MGAVATALTPARWQMVKAILADALEQPGAAERAAFLAGACAGDAELCREVESLLAQQTGGLERFAAGAEKWRGNTPGAEEAGRRVGAYELVRELGHGGMGAVFLARRADGRFDQQVAVKLLKRGTDTEEVLRRFRVERQILARLVHPNIARLLDGGETAQGLPFFVLEYVPGTPLTEFARQRGLSVDARLILLRQVCAAVAYAHQHLVIHRDLKPGNILVTAEGEPKLLDFGIAKLLVADDADAEHTLPGHARLTPAYASPEQARGESVTTASDVYALGALLYELLTGRSPHPFSGACPGAAEIARVVGTEPALRPSLAASDSATGRELTGDLDNILLKALDKEPARRYLTVNALAEDLRRYAEGQPVRARAATRRYLACKFVARNRLGVAAAGLVLLAVAGGIAGTLWQARLAQRRFEHVRRLAHGLLFEVDDALAHSPTAARELLVRRVLENLDELAADAGRDAKLRRELADAYRKAGDMQSRLHTANIGNTAGALAAYDRAIALREGLLAQGDDPAGDARAWATDHGRRGDMLSKTGDTAGALNAYRQAVELLISHPPLPADREGRRVLGQMRDRLGCALLRTDDLPGAERLMRAGRADRAALAAEAPDDAEAEMEVTNSDCSLAYLLSHSGRMAEALALIRRNAAVRSRLAAAYPDDPVLQRAQMAGREWLGLGATWNGDARGALPEFAFALGLAESALARDPANTQAHNDLGDVLLETGDALRLVSDLAGARDNYRRALVHFGAVADADPVNVHARRQVLYVKHRFALALAEAGDTAAAQALLADVVPQFAALCATDSANADFRRDYADSVADLAALAPAPVAARKDG